MVFLRGIKIMNNTLTDYQKLSTEDKLNRLRELFDFKFKKDWNPIKNNSDSFDLAIRKDIFTNKYKSESFREFYFQLLDYDYTHSEAHRHAIILTLLVIK